MKKTMVKLSRAVVASFALVTVSLFLVFSQIVAATTYSQGETLTPDCAPGDVDCGVAVVTYSAGLGMSLASSAFSIDFTSDNTWTGVQSFSGAISAPTTLNTINDLVINAGALSGVASISGTGALTIASGGTDTALTLSSTGAGATSLDSATTGAVNIGTSSNAKTITVGNTTGATSLVFNSGSAGVNFDSGTLFVDSANNRVGVGLSSPGAELEVTGSVVSSRFVQSPYKIAAPKDLVYVGRGTLTSITSAISAGNTPFELAVDPTGRYVYTANFGASTISSFVINQTTGVLTTAAVDLAGGTGPYGIAVDPTGRFVYVTNSSADTVSMYSINQATGELTSITSDIASGDAPFGIAVDPTGRFVYVTNATSNDVSMYSINQTTGELTTITTAIAAESNARRVAVDPTGRFVYVVNNSSNTVSQYRINQTTGALTSITSAIATETGPVGVAVDPSGRFVYVANGTTSNSVSQYSIDQSTGALTVITTAVATASAPRGVAIDPTGHFVYVGNLSNNSVSMFSINQSTGALTILAAPVSAGTGTAEVVVDPSGRFVYAANKTSNNVSMFTINNFNGADGSFAGDLTVLGSVGIGQTAPGYLLHVGDTSVTDATVLLRLEDANSTCDFTADAGAPTCGSDRTLKKNISTYTGSLKKILGLRPVTYNWKTEEDGSPVQYGFIAQEVEEQLPHLVKDGVWIDGSTKKFLNIGGMMPFVVGAIQDLQSQIDALSKPSVESGTVMVSEGENSVFVAFDVNFGERPSVVVTPLAELKSGTSYWISGVTAEGFTLNLSRRAGATMDFDWMAVSK